MEVSDDGWHIVFAPHSPQASVLMSETLARPPDTANTFAVSSNMG